jgi:polar amino acid transport system permease protein
MGGLVFALALLSSANEGLIGSFLRPAMSEESLAGWWGRLSTSMVLAGFTLGLGYGLLSLSRKAQLVTVWLLLAMGALGFFLSFNLSFEFIGRKLPFLITTGAFTTLYVSAISITLAFILALLGASAKMSGIGVIEGVGAFYTSYFRGVPLLVQLFLIYLGLPQVGIIVPPVPAAIAALALVYGAYMTEIFRSGIQSISVGQWEAADALGLQRMLTFRKVILPQAMRVIVPPTGNQFIAMLKDSSLVSVVGVWDIMFIARTQGRADFKILEMLITASVIYWVLSVLLEFVQQRIEAHYSKAHQR